MRRFLVVMVIVKFASVYREPESGPIRTLFRIVFGPLCGSIHIEWRRKPGTGVPERITIRMTARDGWSPISAGPARNEALLGFLPPDESRNEQGDANGNRELISNAPTGPREIAGV